MAKRKLQSFDAHEEEYYREHPDEIEGYLKVCFEEYAKDQCTPALLSSLRMVARVKGISAIADRSRDDTQWGAKSFIRRRQSTL